MYRRRCRLLIAAVTATSAALGIIGYLAKDADQRALRRLKQVGRVQYAQELAAKDRDTVANRPLQRHLYADAVPNATQWRSDSRAQLARRSGSQAVRHSMRRAKVTNAHSRRLTAGLIGQKE